MSSTQQLLLTEGGGAIPNYIEDVFSTYLYTGNGSTQTINNGIDLAGKGGLVWIKSRNIDQNHLLYDTARGVLKNIQTNNTGAQQTSPAGNDLTTFGASGFSLGTDYWGSNSSGINYASWTFRKQPKFFDVVTFTGTGSVQNIAHNLGSTPGCIIIKSTTNTNSWVVYHNGIGNTGAIYLNLTNATSTSANFWNNTDPTSTQFTVGVATSVNQSGQTYVAYLFAHDAGGFGLTGTDNVISCGSFTTNGSGNATLNLGYEPQWFLAKSSSTTQDWFVVDSMRGWVNGGANDNDALLRPNLSNAEFVTNFGEPTATGFNLTGFTASQTYIYIAIRRGPMKVPTDGTKVFSANTYTTPSSPLTVTTGFPIDLSISTSKTGSNSRVVIDRLRSVNDSNVLFLETNTTAAETTTTGLSLQNNTALVDSGFWAGFSYSPIYWSFGRAPSFFDEVCFTLPYFTTGSFSHNLGVAPEMMIVKTRNGIGNWYVYHKSLGTNAVLYLAGNYAADTSQNYWSTSPTSTQFSLNNGVLWGSANTAVAYLFATCAGVSKVGSYTGNGSSQTINCGFTGGARFVLIKRTDAAGDWYIYDTARGMTTLVDPYLLLNSTAAESATLGSVTTVTTGFAVNASILAAINTNGASYIYLSIA